MEKQREPIWWLPLLRRVALWGITMTLLWDFVALMLLTLPLAALLYPDTILGADNSSSLPINNRDLTILLLQMLIFLLLGAFSLCGLITGTVSGLCAPTSESVHPLRSRFFRTVGIHTVIAWILSSFVAGVGITTIFGGFFYFGAYWYLVILALWFGLFGLGLWRALNRALAATKLK